MPLGHPVCRITSHDVLQMVTPGIDPRGDEYFWIGPQRDEEKFLKGTDLAAVNNGYISVTPLALDLTDTQTLRKIKGGLK